MSKIFLTSSFPGVANLIKNNLPAQSYRVAFITTAANLHPPEKRSWIEKGRQILESWQWLVQEIDIANKDEATVRAELADAEIIFVEGGNPIYLLEQMQNCNFQKIIEEKLAQGAIYLGESAGSIVAGRNVEIWQQMHALWITPSPAAEEYKTKKLKSYQGLNLVNFYLWPHWNSQDPKKRQERFDSLASILELFYSQTQPLICLNDNQLIYVQQHKFEIWEESAN